MLKYQLVTDRCTLTPVKNNDLNALHQLWIKPEVRKFLWDDIIIPKEQTKEIIEASGRQFRNEQSGLWLIRLSADGTIVGFAGLWYFFEETQPQLLYGLVPKYFGFGLATEAAQALVNYAFGALGYSHLMASCDGPHTDSIKVMERLGMHLEREENKNGNPTVFYRLNRTAYAD